MSAFIRAVKPAAAVAYFSALAIGGLPFLRRRSNDRIAQQELGGIRQAWLASNEIFFHRLRQRRRGNMPDLAWPVHDGALGRARTRGRGGRTRSNRPCFPGGVPHPRSPDHFVSQLAALQHQSADTEKKSRTSAGDKGTATQEFYCFRFLYWTI